ncbi:MAG: hypothetical protein E6Q65_00785 [Ottowia sp.]|nr:MAG: hypothetical protein E6Q65_00785 [Ottowia sp.]
MNMTARQDTDSFWARARRGLLVATGFALLSLAACGGNGDDEVADRGPTTIEVQAKLNGLDLDGGRATVGHLVLAVTATNNKRQQDKPGSHQQPAPRARPERVRVLPCRHVHGSSFSIVVKVE